MQNTITLAMIVTPTEEEAKKLDTALASVKGIFDEIVITQAGSHPCEAVEEVAKKYGAEVSFFTWIEDFAAARNFNFSQATGDWIFWMDADDIIKGANNIRKNVEVAESKNITGLSMMYNYSHDEFGNVADKHMKVQLVKNGVAEWKGKIHEDLLPKAQENWASVKDVTRVHNATEEDSARSLLRNIGILEDVVKTEPEEPRHYFYMARCYLGLEKWQEVVNVIDTYLTLSNWKGERYEALNMVGEAYMHMGKLDESLKAHTLAILEVENAPDAYIYKARVYVQKEQWTDAITCLDIAELRDKEGSVLKRTALYDHDLYLLAGISYMNLGEYRVALEAVSRAYNNRKSDKAVELVQLLTHLVNNENLTLQYLEVGKAIMEDKVAVNDLIKSIPTDIKDDPRLLALQFGSVAPTVWDADSYAIYCGNSVESWDGDSVNNGGIGGSETAVVEIAKRLVAKGRPVTVYNRCDADFDGKVIDGVTYKNYWQFNKEDVFGTVWLWRSPLLVDNDLNAQRIIVDMHDVSSDAVFTPERLEKIDTVFVKTQYHRELYPSIPDDKVKVVGNGIDMDRFETGSPDIVKLKNRFMYTSAPNRGLEQVLDMWPDIRKAIPDAELHIYYGWETFYKSQKNLPAEMEWMKQLQKKAEQGGVINHGRVGQVELASDMLKSNLWLYPTSFAEIHCITALEMQAACVTPITTGFAALAETQVSGVKIDGDTDSKLFQAEFVNAVVLAYKGKKADEDKGYEYAQSQNWNNITEQWM